MPTISRVLPNFSLIPLSKILKGGVVDNTSSLYGFGPILPSQVCRLHGNKVDNLQEPSKFNNFGKPVNHGLEKRMFTLDEYVVSQNFVVRLYELDIHQKASLEALLNYTQETGLNLFQSSGLVVEGIGVSKEMTSRNVLISFMKTRRLSKIPEEIKARGDPYVKDYLGPLLPAVDKDNKLRKLHKLEEDKADNITRGIKPLWFDLDPNQHVNNVKYISWILEGTPEKVRENYELAAITLECRRECGRESVLQSLSGASNEVPHEFHHLLRLENGNEVARARTLWRKSDEIMSIV